MTKNEVSKLKKSAKVYYKNAICFFRCLGTDGKAQLATSLKGRIVHVGVEPRALTAVPVDDGLSRDHS